MKIIDKIYSYLFLLFCFILPFEHSAKALPNIILLLLVTAYPFHSLRANIKTLKKELIAILLFIAVIVANNLIFQRWEDFSIIARLFYIPMILILSSPIKNIKPCLTAFVTGAFALCSISSVLIIIKIFNDSNFSLVNGEGVNDLLFGHRPYLGFMYLMVTFFAFYLAVKSSKKTLQILYVIAGIGFISFIFLIAARLSAFSVLISMILALIYFARKIKINSRWFVGIPLFIIVLGTVFSGNLAKRFYINDEKINFILAEPRYYIWDCAYNILPDNPKEIIFGKGYQQTQNELTMCYRQKDNFLDAEHKQWFINSQFNTHNQFLDLFISQGIIACLLSLLFFSYLMITTRKDFFSLGLTVAFLLFFIVENVLIRQFGCILIALLLCFVFRQKKFQTEIESNNI